MEPIREADVQTQPGKRLAESPKRQKKNGKTGKIIACAAAAAVVVLIACTCRVTIIPDPVVATMIAADGNEVVGEALSVAEQDWMSIFQSVSADLFFDGSFIRSPPG